MTCKHNKDHCLVCNRYLCFDDYAPELYAMNYKPKPIKQIHSELRHMRYGGAMDRDQDLHTCLICVTNLFLELLGNLELEEEKSGAERAMREVQDLASVSELEAHSSRKDKVDLQGVSSEESRVED